MSVQPNKRMCLQQTQGITSRNQQLGLSTDDDDIWDEMDESVIEECMLMASQALIPEKKPLPTTKYTKPSNNSVNGYSKLAKPPMAASVGFSNNNFLAQKFSDFNKTGFKGIGSQVVAKDTYGAASVLPKISESTEKNVKSLQEELLIKQGEISNLRNELSRKISLIEAERIDRVEALEAAEKRGKEKCTKSLAEHDAQIKTLRKQLERSQSDILFKDREMEELTHKCRQLEHNDLPPSKRKSGGNKITPTKTTSANFNDRFDFTQVSPNSLKKRMKHVEIQTETIEQIHRPKISILDKRGVVPKNRTASLVFSSSSVAGYSSFSCVRMPHGIEPGSSTRAPNPGSAIAKRACEQLKAIRERISTESGSRTAEVNDQWYAESSSPHLTSMTLYDLDPRDDRQRPIEEICTHLKLQSMKSLKALYSIGQGCVSLPKEVCDVIIISLKNLLDTNDLNDATKLQLCRVVSTFSSVEQFRVRLCLQNSSCILSSFSKQLLTARGCGSRTLRLRLCRTVVSFISLLLLPSPPSWFLNGVCGCSSSLLSSFICLLHYVQKSSSDDDFHVIFSGIKVLHRWQTTDPDWWEKVAPMPQYTALMSATVRNLKIMKDRGILDASLELLYDLYEVDETVTTS